MALLWLDSFDHYATADIAEKYSSMSGATIVAAAGRRSSAALRLASFSRVTKSLAAGDTTCVWGAAVKVASIGTECYLIVVRTSGSAQMGISVISTGFLRAYRASPAAGTVLGTAVTGALTAGTYYYIEMKTVIHPSAGTVVLRVNELEVLNLSGVNTAQTGSATWNEFNIGDANISADYDDMYVLDGTGSAPLTGVLGDCRVDARYPTAEGTTIGWTPLSGSDNALMVDDTAPDDDTTYNATATIPATDTYVVQDAPLAGATLYGVQLVVSQKKTDAGTCSIAPVVRHSSVDYPGTAINPTTAYGYAVTPYGLNPGTSAAWTEAHFNAAEFGVKRTA